MILVRAQTRIARSGHVRTNEGECVFIYRTYRGIEWSHPIWTEVLAKFGLCSNCSQKLDVASLARARMLGFWLKFPVV